jgi:hypothetical protein
MTKASGYQTYSLAFASSACLLVLVKELETVLPRSLEAVTNAEPKTRYAITDQSADSNPILTAGFSFGDDRRSVI